MDYYAKSLARGIDDKVDGWMTVGSPVPMLTIVGAYLVFVEWLGPKLMEHRKPLNLKPALIVYNAFQIAFTLYILTLPLRNPAMISFGTNCQQRGSRRGEPWFDDIVYIGWCYYISKFIDLLDTVFFVLRKKSGQITFLHVWHHAVIVPSCWAYLKYLQDPAFTPLLLLNTAVHVIMYTYYLIAALGPQYARFIWWKKYMTRIQLGQFVLVIFYLGGLWACQCHISKSMALYVIVNNFILIGLFGNFYYNAYNKKKLK